MFVQHVMTHQINYNFKYAHLIISFLCTHFLCWSLGPRPPGLRLVSFLRVGSSMSVCVSSIFIVTHIFHSLFPHIMIHFALHFECLSALSVRTLFIFYVVCLFVVILSGVCAEMKWRASNPLDVGEWSSQSFHDDVDDDIVLVALFTMSLTSRRYKGGKKAVCVV